MALTDIVFYELVAEANRGNVGIVQNTTASNHTLYLTTPLTSDVKNGTIFGLQNSLTGTLIEGISGGPTYYAYG